MISINIRIVSKKNPNSQIISSIVFSQFDPLLLYKKIPIDIVCVRYSIQNMLNNMLISHNKYPSKTKGNTIKKTKPPK